MAHVARCIQDHGALHDTVVIGWETMNEPSMSWLGNTNLKVIPKDQHLRKGTCPTPAQAIMLGSGISQKVEVWDFGMTGPKYKCSTIVNPAGSSIWFRDESLGSRFHWRRSDGWHLGECIWAQHGVWDPLEQVILRPDYFARAGDETIISDAVFLKHFWLPHFREYKRMIRAESPNAILFCQPPVLKVPPIFDDIDRKDQRIVYSPHFVRP